MRKTIPISRVCNNNCIFCGAADNYDSLDSLDDIILELKDGIKKGFTTLSIEGREPTIFKEFVAVLKIAKKLGYKKINLITNGRRFANSEFTKKVVNYLHEVFFSIHGPNPLLHDSLTRTPGSFDQSVKGIAQLQKNGFKNIALSAVVVKQNYRCLKDMVKFFSRKKIKKFEFSFVGPGGNALRNFHEVVPTITETAPHLKRALNFCEKNALFVKVRYYPPCIIPDSTKFIRHVTHSKEEELKEHIKGCCEECSLNKRCNGFWGAYLEEYGTKEFKPI